MTYSWANDETERDAWVAFARTMEGLTLGSVRYFNLDYRRDEFAPDHLGPRLIDSDAEWVEPTWEFPGGHTLDFGIELADVSGSTWSLSWIPPGPMEGLALTHEPLLEAVLSPDATAAVWDVSARTAWSPLIGRTVQSVRVHYEPWDAASNTWWCRRVEIDFPGASIEVLEAEGTADGGLSPSADNLVVRFQPR